ncbi:hypothetical protein RY27_15045, partial [Litorilinea aerophila]
GCEFDYTLTILPSRYGWFQSLGWVGWAFDLICSTVLLAFTLFQSLAWVGWAFDQLAHIY